MRFSTALLAAALLAAAVLTAPVLAQDAAPIASGMQTNGKARADILSVKRSEGDTITLRFQIVNGNNEDMTMTIGNMELIDLVGRRSYSPGVSSPCRIKSGEKSVCWAVFAAPPASVKQVNAKFYEGFDLIAVPLAN